MLARASCAWIVGLSMLVHVLGDSPPIKVFIDQDSLAGGSNVLSIAMLLTNPKVDVVGIGVIAGDSSIDDAVFATLQVVEACGKPHVPVARGAGRPFLNSGEDVYRRVHMWGPKGGDGWLGEWREDAVPAGSVRRIPGVPDPSIKVVDVHAAQLLIECARRYPGELVLYTAGPLTNIALAIHLAPDIVDKIAAVYTMAGALEVRSKFNFWWDAESAAVFLRQPWRKKMLVPIDVCQRDSKFTRELLDRTLTALPQGPLRNWLHQSFLQPWAEFNLPMWDEITAAVLVDPSLIMRSEQLHIGVDHTWGPLYGATLFYNLTRSDNGGGHQAPAWTKGLVPWDCVHAIDQQRFEEHFVETLKSAVVSDKTRDL